MEGIDIENGHGHIEVTNLNNSACGCDTDFHSKVEKVLVFIVTVIVFLVFIVVNREICGI